jgi:hypothetical protein
MDRCGFFLWKDFAELREKSQLVHGHRPEEPQAQVRRSSPIPDSFFTAKDSLRAQSEQKPQVKPPSVSFIEDPFIKASASTTEKKARKRKDSDDDAYEIGSDDERAFESLAHDTPSKSDNDTSFTTPKKRKFSTMVAERGLPTPETGSRTGESRSSELNSFLDLISPDSTPTPLKFRDAVAEGEAHETLAADVIQILQDDGVGINEKSKVKLRDMLNQYSRKMVGLSRS